MTGIKTRRILKVKNGDGKIEIQYEIEKPDGKIDGYSLRCTDKPAPAFVAAFDGLKPAVAGICEMAEEWGANLTIKGVSFSWTDGIMGAVITATKPLVNSNSPLCINTPHKPKQPYCDGPGGDAQMHTCLTEDQVEVLSDVLIQAGKYIDGDREQGQLFPPAAAAGEKPAGDDTAQASGDKTGKCAGCKKPVPSGEKYCGDECFYRAMHAAQHKTNRKKTVGKSKTTRGRK